MNCRAILFYDGYCYLCTGFGRFIRKYDKRQAIRFLPLQSSEAQRFLADKSMPLLSADTVILWHRGKLFEKSDVSFEVLRILGGGFRILLIFSYLPKRLRDAVYDWVARNRYRWWGKKEECEVV